MTWRLFIGQKFRKKFDGRIFGKVNLVSNILVSDILVSDNLVSDNLVSNKSDILVSDNLVRTIW